MALPQDFPTAGTPDLAANSMVQIIRGCRGFAVEFIAACVAGSLDLERFITVFLAQIATRYVPIWTAAVAVPGVLEELQRQFPNKSVTQANLNSVLPAMQTLIGQIETNCPVDASNRILHVVLLKDGTGRTTPRLITNAGQLATLKTALETFRDALDAA